MSDGTSNPTDAMPSDSIDAHAHVWTPDLQQYPLAAGYSPADMQPSSFTAQQLLTIAQAAGVRRVVLIQMLFYGHDNRYMLDCMRQFPGVFAGVAQIDEQGNDPAAEMRGLKAHGVRGIRISSLFRPDPQWLEHAGMQAMWKCGGDERIAICPLINPSDLPAIDRMCELFPATPVVIDHCARIGGDGVVRDADLDNLCRLARHAHTYVKLSAFYFLGSKQPPYTDLANMIRRLCDAFNPERLMWASDCPFQLQPPHSYAASLELLTHRLDFLSESDKLWILRGTAEEVFFS